MTTYAKSLAEAASESPRLAQRVEKLVESGEFAEIFAENEERTARQLAEFTVDRDTMDQANAILRERENHHRVYFDGDDERFYYAHESELPTLAEFAERRKSGEIKWEPLKNNPNRERAPRPGGKGYMYRTVKAAGKKPSGKPKPSEVKAKPVAKPKSKEDAIRDAISELYDKLKSHGLSHEEIGEALKKHVNIDKKSNESDVWATAQEAYSDLKKENFRVGGIVKVPEMVDKIVKKHSGLSREDASELMKKWSKEGKLTLQLTNDPRLEPRANEGIQSPRGNLFYVHIRDDEPKPAVVKAVDPVKVTVGELVDRKNADHKVNHTAKWFHQTLDNIGKVDDEELDRQLNQIYKVTKSLPLKEIASILKELNIAGNYKTKDAAIQEMKNFANLMRQSYSKVNPSENVSNDVGQSENSEDGNGIHPYFKDLTNTETGKKQVELSKLDAKQLRIRNKLPPKEHELKLMLVSDIKPSQTGEDYDNASSRHLSEHINKFNATERLADYKPIIIDENNRILDGNHRHAAHTFKNLKYIPVLKPVDEAKITKENVTFSEVSLFNAVNMDDLKKETGISDEDFLSQIREKPKDCVCGDNETWHSEKCPAHKRLTPWLKAMNIAMFAETWLRYKGKQGGEGWQSVSDPTDIRYQDEMPGAVHPKNTVHPSNQQKQVVSVSPTAPKHDSQSKEIHDELSKIPVQQLEKMKNEIEKSKETQVSPNLSDKIHKPLSAINQTSGSRGMQAITNLVNHPEWNGPKDVGEVHKKLQEVYNKAEITINFPVEHAGYISSSGKLKNAYESGTRSKGYMDTRTNQEKSVFGVDTDSPMEERPKYAAINFENNIYGAASMYGQASFVLKKDALKGRSTMTAGNSFGHRNDEGVGTFENPHVALAGTEKAIKAAGFNAPGNLSKGYTEVQIWGDLPMNKDTIEEIRIPSLQSSTPGVDKMVDFAQKNGIKVKFFHEQTGESVPYDQAKEWSKSHMEKATKENSFFGKIKKLFGA